MKREIINNVFKLLADVEKLEAKKRTRSSKCDECRELIFILRHIYKYSYRDITTYLQKNNLLDVSCNTLYIYMRNHAITDEELRQIKEASQNYKIRR